MNVERHIDEQTKKYLDGEKKLGEDYEKEGMKYLEMAIGDERHAKDDWDIITVENEYDKAIDKFWNAYLKFGNLVPLISYTEEIEKQQEMLRLKYACEFKKYEFLLEKVKFSFFGGVSGKNSERLENVYNRLVYLANSAWDSQKKLQTLQEDVRKKTPDAKFPYTQDAMFSAILKSSPLYYRCADVLKKAGRNSSAEHLIIKDNKIRGD